MVKKITHSQLSELIKVYYKQKGIDGKKVPLIIYGTFGVGKSAVTKQTAQEIAKERGREYIEWNTATREQKDLLFKNLKNYFILLDVRLSEFDASDIKGLPDFKEDKQSIEWKIPFWATILEQEDSDGILFFDEINLATPLVISSVYKIIYDRVIDESKINENWLIMGCGNNECDRAYTHELASPVRDRGGEVELTSPSGDEWINWAINNDMDSRIIGFVSWKPSNLHIVNFDDGQKFTTERGWARLNTLIKGEDNFEKIDLISGSAIGEGIAREFLAFCKIQDTIKLEEIIRNPKSLEKIKEISIRYFIVTALAEKYKEKKIDFQNIMGISEVLDAMGCAEFVTLLWRLAYKYDSKRFVKDYTAKEKNETERKIKDKYNKYLI